MGDEEDEVYVGDKEHEIYGGEIPGEADVDAVKELDEMKKRLKEEAAALGEMQAKVEKEMGAGQEIRESMERLRVLETTPLLPSTSIEEKDDSLDVWCEDDVSDDAFVHSSLLNREWNRRHEQFHTAGYREGITAGKEASAQVGFNVGFKQSVQVGFNWGLVRGVTSAFTSLPDELKEKVAVTLENKNRLQNLYDSVQTISTTDALKMYHNSIQNTETRQLHSEKSSQTEGTSCSRLDGFYNEIISLLHNSQEIKITMKSGQEMLR